jgi:hypothetical protein
MTAWDKLAMSILNSFVTFVRRRISKMWNNKGNRLDYYMPKPGPMVISNKDIEPAYALVITVGGHAFNQTSLKKLMKIGHRSPGANEPFDGITQLFQSYEVIPRRESQLTVTKRSTIHDRDSC